MPWTNRNGFPYSQLGITMNAWEASGVYGLYKEQQWIYIGETGDMRGRLLEHLGGDNPPKSLPPCPPTSVTSFIRRSRGWLDRML